MRGYKDPTRAWLLGALEGPGRDAVEDRLFGDDAYLAQLEEAEEQLMKEYVQGTLTADEQTGFEEHFLASPRRRRSTELTRDLVRMARTERKLTAASPQRHWLPAMFQIKSSPYQIAMAASLMAVFFAGLSGWLAMRLTHEREAAELQRRQWAVERQTAADRIAKMTRESQTPGPDPGAGGLLSLVLTPGVFRDGTEKLLRIPTDATAAVHLKLLTEEALGESRFLVTIHNAGGDEVWRSDGAVRASTHEADVDVPKGILKPGTYFMTLRSGGKRGGVVADYSFRVVHR